MNHLRPEIQSTFISLELLLFSLKHIQGNIIVQTFIPAQKFRNFNFYVNTEQKHFSIQEICKE